MSVLRVCCQPFVAIFCSRLNALNITLLSAAACGCLPLPAALSHGLSHGLPLLFTTRIILLANPPSLALLNALKEFRKKRNFKTYTSTGTNAGVGILSQFRENLKVAVKAVRTKLAEAAKEAESQREEKEDEEMDISEFLRAYQ